MSKINILFLSCGRRVSLINLFKKALKEEGQTDAKIIGVDINPLAPALRVVDKYYIVPPLTAKDFIPTIIEIAKKEEIKLILPLIDYDLPVLSKNKENIEKETKSKVVVCDEKVIEIANDKYKTYKFFKENKIPTPETYLPDEVNKKFPLFIKPRFGSASKGIHKVEDEEELNFFIKRTPSPIVQQFINGDEYTIDIFSDFEGNVISVVPRKRIEVRSGEVQKSVTVKDDGIINYAKKIAQKLLTIGPITIQCIKTDKEIKFIEINPRFGGGVILSIKAGANSPLYLIKLALGEKIEPQIGKYKVNLYMSRYDNEIFLDKI